MGQVQSKVMTGGRVSLGHSGSTRCCPTHKSLQFKEGGPLSKAFLSLVRTEKTWSQELLPYSTSPARALSPAEGTLQPPSQGQSPSYRSSASHYPQTHLYLRGPLQLHLKLCQTQGGLCQGLTKSFILPAELRVQLGKQKMQADSEGARCGPLTETRTG